MLLSNKNNIDRLVSDANICLEKLSSWTASNLLKINESKTKAVIFKSKGTVCNPTAKLILNSAEVEFVSTVKTLGVIFHEHLIWDSHIQHLTLKLSNIVGVLYRHRHILPPSVKLLIYSTLFNSRIAYCHLVWGTTTSTNINKLFLLQKRAIRTVANTSYYAHTEPLFNKHKVIKIQEYFKYKLATVYVASLKFSDHPLPRISKLSVKTIMYEVRSAGSWRVPRPRTNYGLQMLEHTLPTVLNLLKEHDVCLDRLNKKTIRKVFVSN